MDDKQRQQLYEPIIEIVLKLHNFINVEEIIYFGDYVSITFYNGSNVYLSYEFLAWYGKDYSLFDFQKSKRNGRMTAIK